MTAGPPQRILAAKQSHFFEIVRARPVQRLPGRRNRHGRGPGDLLGGEQYRGLGKTRFELREDNQLVARDVGFRANGRGLRRWDRSADSARLPQSP